MTDFYFFDTQFPFDFVSYFVHHIKGSPAFGLINEEECTFLKIVTRKGVIRIHVSEMISYVDALMR